MWTDGTVNPDDAYETEAGGWSLHGVRPANHPRTRLRQYATWMRLRPGWMEFAEKLADELPVVEIGASTRRVRRRHGFARLRERLVGTLGGGLIKGTRLDTLFCDGLLPLLATRPGRERSGIWFHWFGGDLPPAWIGGLRELGVCDGRTQPICHGLAQGLLAYLIASESRR